jgi:hypothetical protein
MSKTTAAIRAVMAKGHTMNPDTTNNNPLPKMTELNMGETLRPEPRAIAAMLGLKPDASGCSWTGPNPFETGATTNGFVLYARGNAWDRKTDKSYSASEVLAKAENISARQQKMQVGSGISVAQTVAFATSASIDWNAAKVFEYRDADGTLLYQVGRSDSASGKVIRQRRPLPDGSWSYNLHGVRRVLYRLPQISAAQNVFVVEGEKAADALNRDLQALPDRHDTIATTVSGGANGVSKSDLTPLHGKNVFILPDNDEPGENYSNEFLAALGDKATVKVVDLPDRGPKGDYVEFRAKHSIDELFALAADAVVSTAPRLKSPITLYTLDQVFAWPEPEWLIDRFLIAGGTSLLVAQHASFKSFLALDMGMCIETGRMWHGLSVKQGTVVYVAAEGANGLKKRAHAWLAHHEEAVPKGFLVMNQPLLVTDPNVLSHFIDAVSAQPQPPALVIIDTLARSTTGMDENSAKDMGGFAEKVAEIATRLGAHVMVVHHNNRSGAYRGSSALPAAVDTVLSLERKDNVVTLTTIKQKDVEEHPPVRFEGITVDYPAPGATDQTATSLVFLKQEDASPDDGLTPTQRQMVEALTGFGAEGATATEWVDACNPHGIGLKTCQRNRPAIVAAGAVTVTLKDGKLLTAQEYELEETKKKLTGARYAIAPSSSDFFNALLTDGVETGEVASSPIGLPPADGGRAEGETASAPETEPEVTAPAEPEVVQDAKEPSSGTHDGYTYKNGDIDVSNFL